MAKPAVKTVDEYIAAQPEAAQDVLSACGALSAKLSRRRRR